MYNVKTLQDELMPLVGIRQSNLPGIPNISDDLTEADSYLFVDSKNPLSSTENIYYSSPNFQPSAYPLWSAGSNYIKGVIVNDNGNIFYAKNNIINSEIPPSDSHNEDFAPADPFSDWLRQKKSQAVPNMMSEVINRKKLAHMSKSIIEKIQLYRGAGSIRDKISKSGRGVGFSIFPQEAEGLWVILNQIGIQLTIPQILRFYLYHSDSELPLQYWDIEIESPNTFNWSPLLTDSPLSFVLSQEYNYGVTVSFNGLYYKSNFHIVDAAYTPDKDTVNWTKVKQDYNCIMKYLSQNTSGCYYFIYYEDDVIGNALSKTWDCGSVPCANCDGVDVSLYNKWSRYTTFRNIAFPSNAINEDRTLPDLKKASYDSLTNWGMNFNLTVRCDITDFIVGIKSDIADVYAFQICKEFLEAIANGYRIGPNPAQTKLSAIAALDPKAPGNWIDSYNKRIDALNIDLSGFSNACMSCNDAKKTMKPFTM